MNSNDKINQYLLETTNKLKNKYCNKKACGIIQLKIENSDIDFDKYVRAIISVTRLTMMRYFVENEIISVDDVAQINYIVSILRERYGSKPAESLSQILNENKDLYLSDLNELTKRALNITAKIYLVQEEIIKEQVKEVINPKEELNRYTSILNKRYQYKLANNLTEVINENKDLSCTNINIWSKELYGITAKQYLICENIITEDKSEAQLLKKQAITKKLEEFSYIYRNRKAENYEQVKHENSRIDYETLNNWSKSILDKTFEEALRETNIFGGRLAVDVLMSENEKGTISYFTNIDPEKVREEKLSNISFSIRTRNCLSRCRIDTNLDLLNYELIDLKATRGVGKKCLEEIQQYLNGVYEVQSEAYQKKSRPHIINNLKEYKREIFRGEFNNIEKTFNSEEESNIIDEYKNAFMDLGDEILLDLLENRTEYQKWIYIITTIEHSLNRDIKIQKELNDIELPEKLWELAALPFIKAFTKNEGVRNRLKALIDNENTKLKNLKVSEGQDLKEIFNFLNWCNFDIQKDIESLFEEKIFLDTRNLYVVKERSKGSTLREIGDNLNITRERVRQIEKKSFRSFNRWNGRKNVLMRICALRNNDKILTGVELKEYFKDKAELFLFLLKNSDTNDYIYDSQLDVFVVGDNNLSDNTLKFIDTLPSKFKKEKIGEIISDAEEQGIPEEILLTAIRKEYSVTGNVYHRERLSLSSMYKSILKNYYPKGIHISDEEISKLKGYVIENFGNVDLPTNNRAIAARIADIGILCDRGTYKLSNENEISPKLLIDIENYIDTNSSSIIPLSTIYNNFEDELINEGIDNKYYLHGIIKKEASRRYSFKRDYIFKRGASDSIYLDIVEYIKTADYPIDKTFIRGKYPGITDIVVSLAVSQDKVINYFGSYLHADKLKLYAADKEYLAKSLDYILKEGEAVHAKDIYSFFLNDNEVLLNRIFVNSSYSLFSVLEYLFYDKYQFKRPYIANKNVIIEHKAERLKEYIVSADELDISDIVSFARENYLALPSILEYINSLNDTHLLKNKREIIKIENTGVTEDLIHIIEALIEAELVDTKPITQLTCIYNFPSINIPWDEWLIYSILNKWSSKLSVAPSDVEFRRSTPLVSLKGHMDSSNIEVDLNEHVGVIDNIEEIDDLIIKYINDEVEE